MSELNENANEGSDGGLPPIAYSQPSVTIETDDMIEPLTWDHGTNANLYAEMTEHARRMERQRNLLRHCCEVTCEHAEDQPQLISGLHLEEMQAAVESIRDSK